MKTVVYTSDKKTHFFQELKSIYRDIKSSNFLAYQMTKRDIQSQHRQSLLGFFWILAPVIINSLIWLFLNGSGVVNVNIPGGIPYPVFVILGTTIWNIFAEAVQSPITSVNTGRAIISKINFPKEALLMKGLYTLLFNLAIKMIPVVAILIVYQVVPSWNLLLFPFYLVALTIFAFAIGLIITPLGLIYTDISKVLITGIPFLMYITPVVYAAPKVGVFKFLFNLNPLTYIINDTRNTLVGVETQSLLFTVILTVISFIVLLIGLVIFRKSMPIVIEKIAG
ncbi:lipopolysaccharide transport system permease protein [Chryseobacterium ginsenosidimutans]|uniref:ABC transporter permease n=1 Tax=Chryseobacterium ginsenosidimutans TaxID=687846 RepID=UPI00277E3451|nr:ABC transporter permease [Chryseobacterium ginsenosidimutans]MDQ0591897.1 lipopolysaccharide transport system permease protein [Chryseobacterium ginsenosidimutans]